MTEAVQVGLVGLFREWNAEHRESWLFTCITAPCKLSSFPIGSDMGAPASSILRCCHLWHVFFQITMKREERMEVVMSQVLKGLQNCYPSYMATTQSPGPNLNPGICRLAKYMARKWSMFDDYLALFFHWKQNNFLLWDIAVCFQQPLYFHIFPLPQTKWATLA